MKPDSMFVNQMFSVIDHDRNGYLSFRELLYAVVLFLKGNLQYNTGATLRWRTVRLTQIINLFMLVSNKMPESSIVKILRNYTSSVEGRNKRFAKIKFVENSNIIVNWRMNTLQLADEYAKQDKRGENGRVLNLPHVTSRC